MSNKQNYRAININHHIYINTKIMKKLLIIAFILFSFFNIKAQEAVYVGTDQGSTYYVPTFEVEEYGYTQQIYKASEIGPAGNLMYIRFKRQSSGSVTRNVDVYLKHTTKTKFNGPTDWISVTSADKVYSGNVDYGTTGWFQITLDEPFQYNGTDNLVICIDDNTGSFTSYQTYSAYQAQEEAISAHSISQNFDPTNMSSVAGSRLPAKNYICLGMIYTSQTELVMTPNPLNLGSRPNGYWMRPITAKFSNDGMPATITNLTTGNSHVIPSAVSFPYEMNYHDTLAVDFTTSGGSAGNINGNITLTYQNRATATFPYQGTVYTPVSPDVWELAQNVTSLPYNNTFSNVYDNYLLPGNEPDGKDAVYKVVLAEDALFNASVSGANGKIAVYEQGFKGEGGPGKTNNYTGPVIAEPQPFINEWLQYDDGSFQQMIGAGGNFTWAVKFTPSQLSQFNDDVMLTKLKFYEGPETGNATLKIMQGGDWTPEEELAFKNIQFTGLSGWRTLVLDNAVDIDRSRTLWIIFSNYDIEFPAASCAYNGDGNSCMFSPTGEYFVPTTYYNINCTFMIRGFVTNVVTGREMPIEPKSNSINNMVMIAGTYYVVASSTANSGSVSLSKTTIPSPVAATAPTPSNNSTGVTNPSHLAWTLGQYTTEYQVLLGTTNPPTTVAVAWTHDLRQDYIAANLQNHTKYYWRVNERNSSGVTNGTVWSFTTKINEPSALNPDHTNINEGDNVILSWNYEPDRAFRGFNIYKNDVKINGNTPVNAYSYTVSGLTYNTQGYKFNVTAVYNEGESAYSNDAYVYVSGASGLSGHVFEQDGTTPIANATVRFKGRNILGDVINITFQTDSNGYYEGDVDAGSYRVSASKNGYTTTTLSNNVNIIFGQAQTVNINMIESYGTVSNVTVQAQSNTANISWSGKGDRSFSGYKVYRTLAENEVYTSANTNVVATGLSGTSCSDNSWANAAPGVYKFGVAKCYAGNRTEHNTVYACNVYDGSLPFGYISYNITNPTSTATVINANLDLRGGDYYDGYVYAYDGNRNFYQIDYQTGAIVYQRQTTMLMVDCAFDYSTGRMYGTYAGNIYIINLADGEATLVGNTGLQSLHTLACTLNGRLYGISYSDGILYTINKNTAEITAIGPTGQDCLVVQSANFDHNTETLYWAGYDDNTHGFLATVDVETAETTIFATNTGEQTSWFIPFDENLHNAPIQNANEGVIVWSEGVDKDMTTTVTVNVSLEDGGNVAGTHVGFVGEDGTEYNATLNETGTYTFNNFRRGAYTITIDKAGYITYSEDVTIWDNATITAVLQVYKAAPRNLFVSSTGYAMWDNNTTPACDYYYYQGDFVTHPGMGYNGADASAVCGMSAGATSFGKNGRYTHSDGYYLFTDEFVCDGPAIINSMEFYAYQSQSGTTSTMTGLYIQIYDGCPREGGNVIWGDLNQNLLSSTGFMNAYRVSELYYGLSYTANPIMYLDADNLGIHLDAGTYWVVVGFRGNDDLDGPYGVPVSIWDEPESGNSLWKYWDGWTENYDGAGVKGITMILSGNRIREQRETKTISGYEVRLNDETYANVTTPYIQFDTENLIPGQQYTTSVKTVYGSESSSYSYFTWTYNPCENYESPLSINAVLESKGIIINWDMSNINEDEVVGSYVYRDGIQLFEHPISENTYVDHNIEAGLHTYSVRVVYGNESTLTDWYSMSCPISVDINYDGLDEQYDYNINVYPNPTDGLLNIEGESIKMVTVVNTLGQVMAVENNCENGVKIDMSLFENGVYIIKVLIKNDSILHFVTIRQ